MADQNQDPFELPASLRKRFYEPLVLLYSLSKLLVRSQNSTKPPDLESADDKSPVKRFECFVNKLGQVCDSERGGDTVTAFAILQTGSVEYRFASNSRDQQRLNETAVYVRGLLHILGQASQEEALQAKENQDSELFSDLMRRIIEFNQPRISFYIRNQLLEHLDFCFAVCYELGQEDDLAMGADLDALRHLAELAGEDGLSPTDFTIRTRELLRAISERYRQDRFRDYMSERTREDREVSIRTPWTELYHGVGRLESYSVAVKVFLRARNRWPQLFEDFQVAFIPSSGAGDTPSIRRSSKGIITRLTADRSLLEAFLAAPGHQDLIRELDGEIFARVRPRRFQPIVHAEVNLARDIIRDERHPQGGQSDRVRFFNEALFGRYIGCSKPTCQLCALYFQAPEGPDMRVRPGHENLYYNWRTPDIESQDGAGAAAARNRVLEWMVLSIKERAVQTIRRMFTTTNLHDSNTTPSNPPTTDYQSAVNSHGRGGGGGAPLQAGAAWDSLSAAMGQMSLGTIAASQSGGSG